jgi:hypothetical protein
VRYDQHAVTRKYPLDPLKRVRAEKVDQRKISLSDALRKAEATSSDVERKTQAKGQLDRSVSATARGERESLERGELSAADLARGAAWGLAAGLKRQEMARAVDEAQKEDERARAAAEKERTLLATAQAEAKVVEKHHEKWRAARTAAEVARDEESAEEAHLGRPKDGASR